MATSQAPMSSDERRGQCRDQHNFLCVLSAGLRPLCIGVNSHHREALLWQVCSSCEYKCTESDEILPNFRRLFIAKLWHNICTEVSCFILHRCTSQLFLKQHMFISLPHKTNTVRDAPCEIISCRQIFLIHQLLHILPHVEIKGPKTYRNRWLGFQTPATSPRVFIVPIQERSGISTEWNAVILHPHA